MISNNLLNEKSKLRFFYIFIIYGICLLFRCIEYFIIRTDQTFWGEAFIHKLLGIGVLFLFIYILHLKPKNVGFGFNKFGKNLSLGFLLGIGTYTIAYIVEIIICAIKGSVGLQLFVSSYSINGNFGNHTGIGFFALCLLGNFINVLMEEGVFRGLFLKLGEEKYKLIVAIIISSLLFGLWHIVAPIRSFVDGEFGLGNMFLNIIIMVVSSTFMGIKFCMLTKITGSLYCSMADHFVNNTLVNILHVISNNVVDEFQFVRITIAQVISFIVVLIVFIKGKYYCEQKEIKN